MENINEVEKIGSPIEISLSIPKNGGLNPFETLLLKAGKWKIKPILPEGVDEKLCAYSSTSQPKYATTYYISYAGLHHTLPKFYKQVPSSNHFPTQHEAVENSIPYTLHLDYLSIVTIFIVSNYDDARVIGGGITLQIEPVKK